MALALCQCLGFLLAAGGVAGIIAATVMNQWSTQDLENNPVTQTYNFQGLWQTCVTDSSGYTECRSYFTILGLPGETFLFNYFLSLILINDLIQHLKG